MTVEKHSSGSLPVMALAAAILLAPLAMAASVHEDPAPGTFLGAVLVSDDAPAASTFYASLFGWDMERADDGGYAVRHKGQMIAGIAPIREKDGEIEESTWLVGLMVEDVEKSLEIATKQKATIHEEVDRVSNYGGFAVIADRQGAPLLLIEPGRKPLGHGEGHGSLVWAELWTNDIEDAAAFYAKVIGVGHDTVDRGGQEYHVFTSEKKPRSGIIKIPAELENVEPGWAPYVAVSDIAASLAKVKGLGGRIIFGEVEHPTTGSVALILDPSGAALFLYQIGSSEEAK